VIWSEGAAASALICDEANAARQQKKLIQVSADGRAPPAPFDQAPVAQLSGWRGESGHPGWRQVIEQLEAMSASSGGAKAKQRIASALRAIPLPSFPLPRHLRADPVLALPSPYNPVGSRNRRRFEPATALLLVALTSAAGAAGWVGGRQQGMREGAEMAAAGPAQAFHRCDVAPVLTDRAGNADCCRRSPCSSEVSSTTGARGADCFFQSAPADELGGHIPL
jgi:hypothetical protein